MSVQQTISGFLALLEVDPSWESYRIVQRSDMLRRQQQYEKAVSLANAAIRLTRHNSEQLGIVLLYAGYARADSHQPEQMRQAIRDCDRAVRVLNLRSHNQAIALVVRGLIGSTVDEQDGWADAVVCIERARRILANLIQFAVEHNQHINAERYRKLDHDADKLIKQLLSEGQRQTSRASGSLQPAAPRATRPPAISESGRLHTPEISLIKVIWPQDSDSRIDLSPTPEEAGSHGYIDTEQISIDGHPHRVESVDGTMRAPNFLRLFSNKSYLAIPLVETGQDRYAVVRVQNKPDREWQYVIVQESPNGDTWLDQAESTTPFKHVHIVGLDRQWVIDDNEQSSGKPTAPQILGVVEAILCRETG